MITLSKYNDRDHEISCFCCGKGKILWVLEVGRNGALCCIECIDSFYEDNKSLLDSFLKDV